MAAVRRATPRFCRCLQEKILPAVWQGWDEAAMAYLCNAQEGASAIEELEVLCGALAW